MLRAHEPLLLHWFRAKGGPLGGGGEISAGAVEGLSRKIRVVAKRSYRFRTYEAMEIALDHDLGRLPEPESTQGALYSLLFPLRHEGLRTCCPDNALISGGDVTVPHLVFAAGRAHR